MFQADRVIFDCLELRIVWVVSGAGGGTGATGTLRCPVYESLGCFPYDGGGELVFQVIPQWRT